MRVLPWRLWRVFVMWCCGLALSPAVCAWAAPIAISSTTTTVIASPHTEVLEDPSGTLTLTQVREATAGWRPGPPNALVFGFSRSAYWVRWQIENTLDRPARTIIDLGSPRQDHVRWTVRRGNGEPDIDITTGDRVPYAQRPSPARDFVLPLDLGAKERVDVLVRLASHDGVYEAMPLKVHDRLRFLHVVDRENIIVTLFHGGLLALMAYNLLLFLATRDRAFGWYVLYLASFILWSLTFRGYAFQYLWPEAPDFNNDMLTVFAAAIFASAGVFAIVYLRMRTQVPRWLYDTNRGMVALNLLVCVPALCGAFSLAVGIGMVTGISLALTSLCTAVWLLHRGSRQARFYVLAFGLLIAGAVAYILQIVQALPANPVTTWGLLVGSAFEVLLLALGLADSLNTLKAEKLGAERRMREAQETLSHKLEQQVSERTHALELANRRLNTLAITDELTGAFNRRHFNAVCAELLADPGRREPLALCMFDIDHFKAFNDRHGHSAGDDALRDVSAAVRAELRRSGDALFRLGGEEFGVLFTAGTADAAWQFAERLRLAVQGLGRAHAANAVGVVTASFGVGWWPLPPGALDPDTMYMRTDALLYEAKAGGRNRVVVGGDVPSYASSTP